MWTAKIPSRGRSNGILWANTSRNDKEQPTVLGLTFPCVRAMKLSKIKLHISIGDTESSSVTSALMSAPGSQSCAKTNADRTVDCKDYDTCELIINSGIGSCNVGQKTNGYGLGQRGSQLFVKYYRVVE
ncbi:uncharacterized protein RAG0_15272 [Rhynchosporium agropyri]|uniref:Uncharacterized protein n=1 Tax=Rhynchosporium agropyri TaxID=914238 RepID=A0A1E1LKE3_9HELO|nr:uncharacterized protein RAG0_15272 [Rhynchosporium agropyri]